MCPEQKKIIFCCNNSRPFLSCSGNITCFSPCFLDGYRYPLFLLKHEIKYAFSWNKDNLNEISSNRIVYGISWSKNVKQQLFLNPFKTSFLQVCSALPFQFLSGYCQTTTFFICITESKISKMCTKKSPK